MLLTEAMGTYSSHEKTSTLARQMKWAEVPHDFYVITNIILGNKNVIRTSRTHDAA